MIGLSGLDLSGVFFFLTHVVPDQGSGISEATAGNSAAEENSGGEERGFPPHSPHLLWWSDPSAWLGEIPSFRQSWLWEWGSQKEGRGFMAQELGGKWL